MPSFQLKIQPKVFDDIQQGVDYYNAQQKGLGRKFHKQVKDCFATIRKNPFFQIRYDEVRCLPVKKFPFMVHFTIDEINKIITIYTVINTALDLGKNWIKKP